MNPQDFYCQQSRITDPGDYAHLYDAIPDDIESICTAVRNVINHFIGDPRHHPPKTRWSELDTRYISQMLARIIELDNRPLTETREDEKRFVGCCRDFTALTVSILRHKGIPARSRYGTASYFEAGYYWDHVVAEYWNDDRWVMVDAQLAHDEEPQWDFDIRDVPHDRFFIAGNGWQRMQSGQADAKLFGLGSETGGIEFMVTELLLDLAALNREEHLCWECWGFSAQYYRSLSADDKALLNEVAVSTVNPDNFEQWRELFQKQGLALPSQIVSYTPAVSPENYPVKVSL